MTSTEVMILIGIIIFIIEAIRIVLNLDDSNWNEGEDRAEA